MDGIIVVRDNQLLYGNRQYARMLGYEEPRMIGDRPAFFAVHPDDREGVDRYVGLCREETGASAPHRFRLMTRHNRVIHAELSALPIDYEERPAVLGFIRDVSEHVAAHEELKQERQKFSTLTEHAPFGMVLIDEKGNFLYVNPKFEEIFGYSSSEVPDGKAWFHKAYPDTAYRHRVISTWIEDIRQAKPGEQRPRVFTVRCGDGKEKVVNFIPVQLPSGLQIMTCEDITERILAQEALAGSEEKYRTIFENATEGIFQTTPEGRYLSVNPAFAKMFGFHNPQEMMEAVTDIGAQLYVNPGDRERIGALLARHGHAETFEVELYRKDRTKFWVSINVHAVRNDDGTVRYWEGTNEDITDRKKTEEELRALSQDLNERVKELKCLYTVASLTQKQDMPLDALLQGIVDAIPTAYRFPELVCARIIVQGDEYRTANFRESPVHLRAEIVVFEEAVGIVEVFCTREGAVSDEPFFLREEGDLLDNVALTVGKVIERTRTTKALHQSEERYRSIFENAVEGIYQTLPEGRFIKVNPAMARMHGYESPDEMISAVHNIGVQLYVDPEDRARYRKILETEGIVEDFEAETYRKDGTRIWTSVNARAVTDEFGTIICFEGTAEDVTGRKRADIELKKTAQKLRKILAGAIRAMSLTVETKDPYTAGHQARTAALAVAIARRMNMSAEVIDNIEMAASIHDIGKLCIPAEILSKPGILSTIERNLIEAHPQAGYDIIKDAELPCPIADIVLQHHEKLDGTGYPRRLEGDRILLEAQILAVADVVEAISSYRPYRPAHGIQAALDEVEKNRGSLYNGDVVDACVSLFREKGFSFEGGRGP